MVWRSANLGMVLNPNKVWKSIKTFHSNEKSEAPFCVFPKPMSDVYGPGDTLVYLNVYDLTHMNGYIYWAGFGVFHSGVEVHGVEYAFGAHDFPTSGIFEVEPGQCSGFKFRKSVNVGTTRLDPSEVREFFERQAAIYTGESYHLITKNCNHFCEDICYKLTGKKIPKWVNRLAKLGSTFNFILPEGLKIAAVNHDPSECDSDVETPKHDYCRIPRIPDRQKRFSAPSLFLLAPLKGCLASFKLSKSNNLSLKER
ncbi:unnamed protein product [Cuscuta epithymum]|uniref:PPPDE domain-containing protein n=2 Tax=Cuscuta epithymum TaxID=186058 RepID=A0AAV0G9Z5_9ASTE|nr:unnamed protein product [Cuscuta epithymum]CAH9144764.1 unnamed protein product [Cuscuta epithymum]